MSFFELLLLLLAKLYREFAYIMNDVYSLLLPRSLSLLTQVRNPIQATGRPSVYGDEQAAACLDGQKSSAAHHSPLTPLTRARHHGCGTKEALAISGEGHPVQARGHTLTHSFSWPFYFRRLPTFASRVCDGAFSLTHPTACVEPHLLSHSTAALGVDLGPAGRFFFARPFVSICFLSVTHTHTRARWHFAMSRPTVTTTTKRYGDGDSAWSTWMVVGRDGGGGAPIRELSWGMIFSSIFVAIFC